ncbi:MAG: RMD1 family protein [Acidobacteria bacterium]|nr:RMD1 family protein [Acidobacteriota bacterium]MCB9398583.1 RMD1 family protein [Acidobacteriota bacterium]
MSDLNLLRKGPVRAEAVYVAEKIDVKAIDGYQRLSLNPLTLKVEEQGLVVVFRYGVVVFINMGADQRDAFLERTARDLDAHWTIRVSEQTDFHWDNQKEGILEGRIWLLEPSLSRLHVLAHVLAKAAILELFEKTIAGTFDQIEPLAEQLERTGYSAFSERDLVRQIGRSLLVLHKMVGRAEIREKPDVLWEQPELEKLNDWLTDEFELSEREVALRRKVDLVNSTAETLLDILQTKRGLRLEWYIVALIIFEILLSLYALFMGGH